MPDASQRPTQSDAPLLFPGVASQAIAMSREDALLVAAYERVGRTLDDLPYTQAFESLHQAVIGEADAGQASRRTLFHRLHNLRKAGRLPKLGRSPDEPVRVGAEARDALARLVVEAVGALSRRDQLPYTSAFDNIVERFNATAGATLEPHDVWRLIARLAK